MEGSESEAVFDSLNLNPQLYINEVLNTVDDLVDDAFNYYLQQASSTLRTDGTDRSQDLTKGVALVQKMIQSVLDRRLVMWEEYCLNHCFEVPEGFCLSKKDDLPSNKSACQDALHDPDLDAQLDSLRNKLTLVGKESAALNRELEALEQQSIATGNCAGLFNEALQSYEDSSFDLMFHRNQTNLQDLFPWTLNAVKSIFYASLVQDQEMARIASKLKIKIGKPKTRKVEETEKRKTERLHTLSRDSSSLDYDNGLANVKLEDLQGFLAKIKNV